MKDELEIANRNRDAARSNFITMQQTAAKLQSDLDDARSLLLRLQEWIEVECGAELPFTTQAELDAFDRIVVSSK